MSELVCEKCGKHIGHADVIDTEGYCCKGCAVGFEVKEIFKKAIAPLALAAIFLFIAYWPLHETASGLELYLKMLFFAGIPFGLKRMCMWIIPTGRGSIAVSAAILVLNAAVGGVIGAFVLVWRVIVAVVTLVKSVVRFGQIAGAYN